MSGFSAAFRSVPLGSVTPRGWLARQLELQADGLTGRLEEIWPDVGPTSAWLGGEGEDWERGPYYLDGLVALAFVTGRSDLRAKAERWVEAILASQDDSGQFGPRSQLDWWPRMVALKALIGYHQATGDPRIPPFVERYLRFEARELPGRPLHSWGRARGVENLLAIEWHLACRGEDPVIRELADEILRQSIDWDRFLTETPPRGRTRTFDDRRHVVNVAMGLKLPALRHVLWGEDGQLAIAHAALRNLDRFHGQATGAFSGDEWLAGTHPSHGVELCAVVELMHSLEQLTRVFGDGAFVDRLERLAFNVLPAMTSADVTCHQYVAQPNQIACTRFDRDWTFATSDANLFGLALNYGCCAANFHQGWPKFVQALWFRTPDGVALASYAPSQASIELPHAARVELVCETDYPFDEVADIEVRSPEPSRFRLLLRRPSWVAAVPQLELNGREVRVEADERGFWAIERTWTMGDRLRVRLPMALRVQPRPRRAVAIGYGPLQLVFPIGEQWVRIDGTDAAPAWEVRPSGAWQYGLVVDDLEAWQIERRPVPAPPFQGRQTPLVARVTGRRVPGWRTRRASAAAPPASPAPIGPIEQLELVPFGSTRLRISEFPRVPGGSGR